MHTQDVWSLCPCRLCTTLYMHIYFLGNLVIVQSHHFILSWCLPIQGILRLQIRLTVSYELPVCHTQLIMSDGGPEFHSRSAPLGGPQGLPVMVMTGLACTQAWCTSSKQQHLPAMHM